MKCDECGAELKRESYVTAIRDGTKKRTVCPSCFQYIQHMQGNLSLYIFILGLILSVILVITIKQSWYLLNISLFYLMCYISIIPHELGHAFAAVLSGLKLMDIRFGRGRRLYSKKLLGFYLDFRAIPVEGAVRHIVTAVPALRPKLFLIYAAGPFANIMIFLLLYSVFKSPLGQESISNGPAPLNALALANLYLGFWNLLPFRSRRVHGRPPKDGLGMILSLFSKKIKVHSRIEQLSIQAVTAFQNKDYKACETTTKVILDLDKNNIPAQYYYAFSIFKLGKIDEAIDVIQNALARPDLPDEMKAPMQSDLSYFFIYKADKSRYDEALELTEEAIQELPWELSACINYGSINILAGDVTKGLKFLNDKRAVIQEKEERAEIHCLLAIGNAKQGNIKQAKLEIGIAKKLDKNCLFLERATAALTN